MSEAATQLVLGLHLSLSIIPIDQTSRSSHIKGLRHYLGKHGAGSPEKPMRAYVQLARGSIQAGDEIEADHLRQYAERHSRAAAQQNAGHQQ